MRRVVALVAISLGLAACGGSTPTAKTSSPPTGTTTLPAVTSPAATPGGTSTSPTPGTSQPGAPSTGGSTPTPAPLGTSDNGRVILARSCIHRGDASEPQELTVKAAPGETVTYSTYYSDYSSELNRPDYKTGYGYGPATQPGQYRATWVVPATATLGRATVQVNSTDMEGLVRASFMLVDKGQSCP